MCRPPHVNRRRLFSTSGFYSRSVCYLDTAVPECCLQSCFRPFIVISSHKELNVTLIPKAAQYARPAINNPPTSCSSSVSFVFPEVVFFKKLYFHPFSVLNLANLHIVPLLSETSLLAEKPRTSKHITCFSVISLVRCGKLDASTAVFNAGFVTGRYFYVTVL